MNPLKLQKFRVQNITDPMISHINMFRYTMNVSFLPRWIASQNKTYHSYRKPSFCTNFFIQGNSLQDLVITMKSTSVVDNATHFFNMDCQATIHPAKVIK